MRGCPRACYRDGDGDDVDEWSGDIGGDGVRLIYEKDCQRKDFIV
jgi:hypothetical protein